MVFASSLLTVVVLAVFSNLQADSRPNITVCDDAGTQNSIGNHPDRVKKMAKM